MASLSDRNRWVNPLGVVHALVPYDKELNSAILIALSFKICLLSARIKQSFVARHGNLSILWKDTP
jgi:hypothetical protein